VSQPAFEVITDPDVEARRKERAEEYGTWECGPQPIAFGGARAFNEGEPVPKSTVERLGLDKLGIVVPTGTFNKKQAETVDAQAALDNALRAEAESQATTTKTTTSKGGKS
jgi:hypothetical protein